MRIIKSRIVNRITALQLRLVDLLDDGISLSDSASSGSSNIISFSDSTLLQVDSWLIIEPYSEDCEFVKISSINGNSISFSTNLVNSHPDGATVLITTNPKWDIRLFGASTANSTNVTEIQAAINNANVFGGTILVPSGIFKITRTSTNILSLASKSNIVFEGDGTIQLTGSLASSDTFMFKIDTTTSNITFRNITLDGGKGTVTNTSEQNHIIEINAGAVTANIEYIKFENVKFKNAVSDAIRMVGTDNGTHRIQYGWVKDCTLDNCGRSGITIQRAVRYFDIIGNTFTLISDQFVDMEPSGTNSPPNNIKIHDNTCVNTTDKVSLSIAGINDTANNHAFNISIQGNTIINGGVIMVYCNDVTFINNVVIAGAQRALDISRLSYNIDISNNRITSSAKGIYLAATANSQYPNAINILSNRITMSGGTGIEMDGSSDTIIDKNIVEAASSSTNGISYRSTVTNDSDQDKRIVIKNNLVDGFSGGISINASPNNISKCKITDNLLKNLTNGVLFAVATGTIENIVVNNINENVTNIYSGLSGTTYLLYTGEPGNVGHYHREGTPESNIPAPVGSWSTDRSNGDIYYKATGTSNTGWVLK